MEHDGGEVRRLRLGVEILPTPERLGVALQRSVREVPVVAPLPVAVVVLEGADAVVAGDLAERLDGDQVVALGLRPLLPAREVVAYPHLFALGHLREHLVGEDRTHAHLADTADRLEDRLFLLECRLRLGDALLVGL